MKKSKRSAAGYILAAGAGAALGVCLTGIINKKANEEGVKYQERYKMYYGIVSRLLTLKNDGRRLADYFTAKGIDTVAIYGVGTLGTILYNELDGSGVSVACFMDARADELAFGMSDIRVMRPDESFDVRPDIIVVTPAADYEEIKPELQRYHKDIDIISLETVVNNV